MKITKQEFDKLYDDSVTKKEYDAIITKIDARFGEIIVTIDPSINAGRNWFDYGNNNYDSERNGGYFDPQFYKTEIDIGGENRGLPQPFGYSIPTRWLWEDFQEDFDAQIKAFNDAEEAKKSKAKGKAIKNKKYHEKLRKSIKSKLTAEELKIVEFKL